MERNQKKRPSRKRKLFTIAFIGVFFLTCRQVLFSSQGKEVEVSMSDADFAQVEKDLSQENVRLGTIIEKYILGINLPSSIKNKIDDIVVTKFEKKPGPTTFRESVSFVGTGNMDGTDVPITIVIAKKLFKQVIGKDEYAKTLISIKIDLATNWKLSNIYSELSFLDSLHFNEAALVLSSFKYSDKKWGGVYKGLNFLSTVNMLKGKIPGVTDFLELLSGFTKFDLKNIRFTGLIIAKEKKEFALRFKVPSDISLPIKDPVFINGMKFTGVSITVKPFEKIYSLGASFKMDMKDVKEPLSISLSGSAKIGIGIDDVSLSGTMMGTYKPAFRIPWLMMKDVGVVVGFNLPTRTIKKIEFRGIAEAGKGEGQLIVDVAGKVNISKDKPPEIALFGDLEEASIQKLILLFSQIVGKKIPVNWLPAYKIKPATVAVIPQKTDIAGRMYDAGTFVRGGIELFGLKGNMYVMIKQQVAKGEGKQEALEFAMEGYGHLNKIDSPYFKFTGVGPDKKLGTNDDGPIIKMKVTLLKQRLFVNGDLQIPFLGIKQQAEIDMKVTNMEGKISGKLFGIFDGDVNFNFNPTKLEEMQLGVNLNTGFETIQNALPEAFNKLKTAAGKGISVPVLKEASQALISAVDKISQYALKAQPVTIKSISGKLTGKNLKFASMPKFDFTVRLNWLNKDLTISSTMDPKDIPKTAESLAKAILDQIVENPLTDLFNQIAEGFEELGGEIAAAVESVVADLAPVWQKTEQAINQYKKKMENFFKDVKNTVKSLFEKKRKGPKPTKPPQVILTKTELDAAAKDIFTKTELNPQKMVNNATAVKNSIQKTVKFTEQYVIESKKVITALQKLSSNISQLLAGKKVNIGVSNAIEKSSIAYFADFLSRKQEMLDTVLLNVSSLTVELETLMRNMNAKQELKDATSEFWLSNLKNMAESIKSYFHFYDWSIIIRA